MSTRTSSLRKTIDHRPIPKSGSGGTIAACIAIVVCMVVVSLCNDASPFSQATTNIDSSVFTYIGSHILQGQMPYTDIFDHKGPYLYLVNAFAYALSPQWGLWVIEMLFGITSALLTFFTCRRFAGIAASTVGTVIAYTSMGISLLQGNYTEQYAMCAMAVTLYCLSGYFFEGHLKRSSCIAIGITAGFVILLRPNMLAIWAVFCIAIIMMMIKRGQKADLLPTIGWALVGFVCCVSLPLLWIAIGGAWSDFIDLYWKFNAEYSATFGTSSFVSTVFWMFRKPTLALACLCVVACIVSDREKRSFWICLLVATLLTVALSSLSGRQYPYYLMAWVALVGLPVARCAQLAFTRIREKDGPRLFTMALAVVFCIAGLSCFIFNGTRVISTIDYLANSPAQTDLEGPKGIEEAVLTHSDETDTIAVYNQSTWIYNACRRDAATRYIFLPEDTRLYIKEDLFYQDIHENHPKLVIMLVADETEALRNLEGLPGYTQAYRNRDYVLYETTP